MKLLLVETTYYAPVSPLFKEACEAKSASDPSFSWMLMDEGAYSWPWTFQYNLLARSAAFQPDVVLFVKGTLATKECLQWLKQHAGRIAVWQPDDPWNAKACHSRIIDAIPFYDLYCTCKTAIIDDLTKAGAQKVVYVPCGYKPEIHFIDDTLLEQHAEPFKCDVAVIGGADAERVGIVKNLLKAIPDLNLKLYGGYWNREPSLKTYAQGHVYGWQYRAAIRHAKLVLNILRSANRDQHNMRTFEIPACGGLMLTQAVYAGHEIDERESFDVDGLYYGHVSQIPEWIQDALTRTDRHKFKPLTDLKHTWNARLEQILGAL